MRPMSTAPRDGTPIILIHPFFKRCPWRWDAGASAWRNDEGLIWPFSDDDGLNPTGWEPCDA